MIFEEFPFIDPFNVSRELPFPEKVDYKNINGHEFKEVIENYWTTNSVVRASNNLSVRNNFNNENSDG